MNIRNNWHLSCRIHYLRIIMKNLIIILFSATFCVHVFAQCDSISDCVQKVNQINSPIIDIYNCNDDKKEKESESKQKGDRFFFKREFDDDSWKYALTGVALAPGAFVLGTAIHEGAHCLAAEAQNLNCYDVRVIPYTDKESGYFYFGSMRYNDPQGLSTPDKDALITAAPMIVNASLISVYSTLAFSNKLPKNKWAKTATFVLAATQVVDLYNHARNTHPYSDSGKLITYLQEKNRTEYNKAYKQLKVPQLGFAIIGTGALAIEGIRIFTDPKQGTKRKIEVVPSATIQGFHLGLHGKF
jgi:hypothetical protein